ncbi:2,3-bisphosphoglycerate-independent phosphoglycerate mutase [Candidatus Falkowbacteria bacterium]|jgi:2,3-bisphosphoglycerate-independent phosphoglycerate mutase|nr:2,3-bisphosphoglycerate-independent phosphoglycerate mutase [Candidatus Falkowbacteria bacterium]MBT4433080.1 2,3-bisphosphoglycerate-independent phosphoglycerate mutase [Candidatus Falkowbacteria bacterium]
MIKKNKSLPLVLLVLDGWGIAKPSKGNAVTLAKTPVFDELKKKYPFTKLCAHGDCVGLPDNQDGNSEAGHMNIGAGRVVEQDSIYIAKSISDGTFFNNPVLRQAIKHVRKNKSKLHIMGLLSSGESAHSSPDHLEALLTFVYLKKVNTSLHFFTDGRDSHQYLAIKLLEKIKFYLREGQEIATLIGRFYAMDRKKKWERTRLAYEALTEGKGLKFNDPVEAITASYNKNESDEFIKPSIITKKGKKGKQPVSIINDNDAIIFYNLRSDRARQLAKVFVQDNFVGFKRKKVLKNIFFTAMTDFGPDLSGITTAFPSRDLKGTLPMALREFNQLYLSESEKYAHITYFFNGGYDKPIVGEIRHSIPSPDVLSYSEIPEMKVYDLTKKVEKELSKNDIIVCNFANADMVGHTGNLEACIKAVESVDRSIKKVKKKVLDLNGTLVITADHGNAEEMIDLETGEINTAHTKNSVPFIIISGARKNIKLKNKGVLGDIAPTILDILDIEKPIEMTGKSLIKKT